MLLILKKLCGKQCSLEEKKLYIFNYLNITKNILQVKKHLQENTTYNRHHFVLLHINNIQMNYFKHFSYNRVFLRYIKKIKQLYNLQKYIINTLLYHKNLWTNN